MALPKPQPRPAQTQEPTTIEAPTSRRRVNGAKAPGFIRAKSATKTRLIANIQGPEKSGKDHMALCFSGGPIYIHSFDIGTEGVVDKFLPAEFRRDKQDGQFYRGAEIYLASYDLTVQPGQDTDAAVGKAANEVWEQFVANYRDSLASTRESGLVLIDTGTEAWELLRLASFGKLTQVMPHHYSKPNAEFRDLVREGFDATNVVWLHKMKPEYENYIDARGQEKGRKTGQISAKYMNDIPFLVQCNVQTYRQNKEGGGVEFGAVILDCREHPEVIGMTIDNDFETLLSVAVS